MLNPLKEGWREGSVRKRSSHPEGAEEIWGESLVEYKENIRYLRQSCSVLFLYNILEYSYKPREGRTRTQLGDLFLNGRDIVKQKRQMFPGTSLQKKESRGKTGTKSKKSKKNQSFAEVHKEVTLPIFVLEVQK